MKKENSIAYGKLEEFCDNFNLTNLLKPETCLMNNHKLTIDLILANKPQSFQKTNVTETGVSDCHKLITTFMKCYISRLKPKNVHYRSYKNLLKKIFPVTLRKRSFLLKQVIPARTVQS